MVTKCQSVWSRKDFVRFFYIPPPTSLHGHADKWCKYPLKRCGTVEYTHLKHAKAARFSVRVFTYLKEFFPLKYSSLGGFYITYQLQLYIKHRNEFLILFLEK